MSAERYLLDTSALITFIEGEPGAALVKDLIQGEQALIPWVALLEVAYLSRRELGEAEADYRYALLKQLPVTFLWEVNEPLLLIAAQLKSGSRISFADSLIASYAVQQKARLVHKDPEFESLGNLHG